MRGPVLRFVRRLRVTLTLGALLSVAAFLETTVLRRVYPVLKANLGWGFDALRHGRLYAAWTSELFPPRPSWTWIVPWLLLLGVGVLEWRRGSRAAALGYLVLGPLASIAGIVAAWFLVRAHLLPALALVPDLGYSSAAVACWCAAIRSFRPRWQVGLGLATLPFIVVPILLRHEWAFDHAVNALVGFAAGPLIVRRPPPEVPAEAPHHLHLGASEEVGVPWGRRFREAARRDWPVWVVAGSAMANGLLALGLLFARPIRMEARLDVELPFGLHHVNRSVTLVFGLALVYLSVNLFRRRRRAWSLALASAVAVGVNDASLILRAPYDGLAPLATILLLLATRRRFTVRSDAWTLAQGLGLAAGAVLFGLAYATFGYMTIDERQFGLDFTFRAAFEHALREFLLLGNPDLHPLHRFATVFSDSVQLVAVASFLLAAASLFRPLRYRLATRPHEREAAARLIEAHGRSSLDAFKVAPDKSFHFAPGERAFLAYRVARGVAVVLGDPVGPDELWPDLVRSFLDRCRDNGWGVAFHQVEPRRLDLYRRLGFATLKIGEEAIVELGPFTATTAHNDHFGRIARRFERLGYRFERRLPPHDDALIDEVEDVSEEWLGVPGRRERGFTMGHFERAYVASTTLDLVRDASGVLQAFANEIPSYAPEEATIDLMRHRLDVPNGAMDFLFLQLLARLKDEGRTRFTLGLAPFAGLADAPGARPEERTVHFLFENLNRFFSFKGLRTYKDKFEPRWESRHLAYRNGPPGLLRAALALVRVTEG